MASSKSKRFIDTGNNAMIITSSTPRQILVRKESRLAFKDFNNGDWTEIHEPTRARRYERARRLAAAVSSHGITWNGKGEPPKNLKTLMPNFDDFKVEPQKSEKKVGQFTNVTLLSKRGLGKSHNSTTGETKMAKTNDINRGLKTFAKHVDAELNMDVFGAGDDGIEVRFSNITTGKVLTSTTIQRNTEQPWAILKLDVVEAHDKAVALLSSDSGSESTPADKPARKSQSRLGDLDALKITLKVTANPKREGSKAHERFQHYFSKSTKTAADFLAAGGTRQDLYYDVQHGYIELH